MARRRTTASRSDDGKLAYVRSLPCCVCHKPGPSEAHHYPTKGAGGDDSRTVPLCRIHHDEFHSQGQATFQARHQIDLAAKAARYHGWYHNDPRDLGF